MQRDGHEIKYFAVVIVAYAALFAVFASLYGCTGAWHSVGEFFGFARDVAKDSGQGGFALLFGAIATWIGNHPLETSAGVVTIGAGVKAAVHGIPGTTRARKIREQRRATREAKKKLDLLDANLRKTP